MDLWWQHGQRIFPILHVASHGYGNLLPTSHTTHTFKASIHTHTHTHTLTHLLTHSLETLWAQQELVDGEGRQGRLAVGTRSGAVTIFNVQSGVDTRLGSKHSGAVTALAWDGDALFSGGQDKVLHTSILDYDSV